MEAESCLGTILVVEDAPSVRRMVCAMLSQTGYNTVEACDGAEALRLLEQIQDVRLVLTDVIMPVMDGAELARQLSRIRPDLRILFMSGYVEDDVVRSLGRVSSMFLAKPFTATVLTDRIRQALDGPWSGISEPTRLSSA
jgi:CheY-like chemotaxis protein